jgi:hypothetical protein
MFKKILITTALVAVIGVLVFGAVTRTQAKTSNESIYVGQGSYSHYIAADVSGEQASSIYAQGQGNGSGNARGQGAGGPGSGGQGAGGQGNLPPASGELSAEEAAALAYMREEEKLAHDVYMTLYAQWGLPVFQGSG